MRRGAIPRGRRYWPLLIGASAWFALAPQILAAQPSATLRVLTAHSTGTAVFVQTGGGSWLLTAYHNLASASEIRFTDRNGEAVSLESLTDAPLCVLTSLDIVAVRASEQGARWLGKRVAPVRLAADLPSLDVGTYAIGHPKLVVLGEPYYPYDFRTDGGVAKRERAGVALNPAYLEPEVRDQPLLLLNDYTITYGFSGGPIFAKGDRSRTLVGIVQGGDPAEGKLAWATPADLIARALEHPEGCTNVPQPLTSQTVWPRRGFRSTAYSRVDSPARIDIDGWTPRPLQFRRGERTDLDLRVHIAGDDAPHQQGVQAEIAIDAAYVPGVEQLSGLEPRAVRHGFVNFRAGFRITRTFEGDTVELPFVVRDRDRTELARFTVRGDVTESSEFEWSADLGLYAPARASTNTHVVVGISPEWFVPGWDASAALRFGAGMSAAFGEYATYDPTLVTAIDRKQDVAIGPRVQILPEIRFWRHDPVGVRVAAGVVVDLMKLDAPHWRAGFPLQIAVAFQSAVHAFVPRIELAYVSSAFQDYRYVDNLSRRDRVARSWALALGAGCSYAASF